MNAFMKNLCAGLLLAGLVGLAQAGLPCASPASPDAPPPARWQKVFARDSDFEIGLRLLGHDGSRIEATRRHAPHFSVSAKGLVALEPVWTMLVDWSVYHDASRATQPTPVLYFDMSADGLRQLCRIERRQLAAAALEHQGSAKDLLVTEITQWRYDVQRRLTAVENWTRSDSSAAWQPGPATCYAYHPRGGLLRESTASGRCGSREKVVERHVYSASQRVLRTIAIESEMAEVDGVLGTVNRQVVIVYDDKGQELARYIEVKGGRITRLPATKPEGVRDFWLVSGEDMGRATDDLQRIRLSPGAPWKVIAIPQSSSGDFKAMPSEQMRVLAEGQADMEGRASTDSTRPAIRQLLGDDGSLVMFWYMLGAVLLVPDITATAWRTCLDETRNTPADCR